MFIRYAFRLSAWKDVKRCVTLSALVAVLLLFTVTATLSQASGTGGGRALC